jgi:murein DD-endopeptidase MepM/ murein hydrolase activator NlpD
VRRFLAGVVLILAALAALLSWSLVRKTPDSVAGSGTRSADPRQLPDEEAAPVASPSAPVVVAEDDIARLGARRLLVPLAGVDVETLQDSFRDMRGGHVHEAIDIPAERGTPVLAVDDGVVRKLFTSRYGGFTVYQFDPSETYCYYYAHLDRYAEGLAEGHVVRQGQRIGYVGTTGNAPPQTPHLHFAIFKLGPERHWWEGVAINPFRVWSKDAAS